MTRLLSLLALCLLSATSFAVDTTLATINYANGQGREHCVGGLAVTTTEQQIILNYAPGESTIVQFKALETNTTTLKIRDVLGDDTTSRTLTPGAIYTPSLSGTGVGGVMTYYVIMASGSGTLSVTRLK